MLRIRSIAPNFGAAKGPAMAKANWYRDQPDKNEAEDQMTAPRVGPVGRKGDQNKAKAIKYKKAGNEEAQISTVMSVPNTKGAILLKKLKVGENVI